jgi:hypothetical protein
MTYVYAGAADWGGKDHRRELRHLNDGNSNQHGDSYRMVSLAHDTILRRYPCWSSPIILTMSPRHNRPS